MCFKWKKELSGVVLSLMAGASALGQTAGQIDSVASSSSGSVDVGLMHHALSAGYGQWNGQFVRGVLHAGQNDVWNGELFHAQEFGDHGTLLAIGDTHTFNDLWYTNAFLSGSSGGFFFPQLRVDVAGNRKWLAQRNLITTVGITAVDSKDGHKDRSLLLGASYYFSNFWIVGTGIRINRSDPGQVVSNAKYLDITYAQDKHQMLSLHYGFGEEAYQFISPDALLVNFNSSVWTATWRKWLRRGQGFQLRAESYSNPYYNRRGVEMSVFQEF